MKLYSHEDLWDMTRGKNDIILCDLDRTLAVHKFPGPIGTPIHRTIEAVHAARRAGKTVIVWSCRFNEQYQRKGRLPAGQLADFFSWCKRHEVYVDGVLELEKPICSEYWGDEATNVEDL